MKPKFQGGQWVRGKDGKLPPAMIESVIGNKENGYAYVVNPCPRMGTMGQGGGGWAYRPYFEHEIELCCDSQAWDQERV